MIYVQIVRATLHCRHKVVVMGDQYYCLKLKRMRKEIIKDEGREGDLISTICRWDIKE